MGRRPIDLHMHTTASDGVLSPAMLVGRAQKCGLRTIAITDHDTCQGVDEARNVGNQLGVEVLTGIELSAYDKREVHVLGYGLDSKAPSVQQMTARRESARRERVVRICDILASYGAPLEPDAVFALAEANVGRPHIAKALKNFGYVKSYNEAFRRFLGRGAVAYVPASTLSVEQAIAFLHAAGGVAVLAHPAVDGVLDRLDEWRDFGLDGVEVFHPGHSNSQVKALASIAARLDLVPTGGSDFHSPEGSCELGELGIQQSNLDELLARRPAAIERD